MRRKLTALLLGSVASVAIMHAASAADLGARPVTKAPPAPPPFSWTGFYIGGHVGAGWARTDLNRDGVFFNNNSNSTVGFIGGGQVGYNYQFTNGIVIGFEGDFTGTTIDRNFDNCFGNFASNCRAKVDWTALATGRLGYAFNRSLLYVKGGGAWAQFRFEDDFPPASFSETVTRSGWTIGGGWEYAFLPNWSAKIEYNFLDLGHHDGSFNRLGIIVNDHVRTQINQVKVGLNWRFGGGGYGGYGGYGY